MWGLCCISRQAPSNPYGVSTLYDLYEGLRRFEDMDVYAARISPERLRQLAEEEQTQVIVHLPGHYMMLDRAHGDDVMLSDSIGATRYDALRLRSFWDGYVLIARRKGANDAG